MTIDRRLAVGLAIAAALLCGGGQPASGQAAGRTWSNVMYLGGVEGIRGKSLDWDNKLTIANDKISFSGKKITFDIDTKAVRNLSYRGHQHMSDGATAAGFAAGGLLGAFVGSRVKATDHYLELEYVLADGSPAVLLLRLHKDNQQEIIDALHAATGIEK